MKNAVMGKSEMIKRLVARSVETAISESPNSWLEEIFEQGFMGYSKLSEAQLLMELEMHGLIQSEDHFDDEAQDADDLCFNDLNFN